MRIQFWLKIQMVRGVLEGVGMDCKMYHENKEGGGV
jgi:hypothetical protein